MRTDQERLSNWARWEFGLSYAAVTVAIAMAVDWRRWGVPLTLEELDDFLERVEGRTAHAGLLELEKLSLATGEKHKGHANRKLWSPTERLLRMFPEVIDLAKAEPFAMKRRASGWD